MKYLFYILLFSVLVSCGRTKKITRNSSTVDISANADSSRVTSHSSSSTEREKKDSSSYSRTVTSETERETKDTAIGISGRTVSQQLTPVDMKPAQTKDGDPVSRTHIKKGQGITSTLTINPDGSADVECTADSLTLLIKGLIREKVRISDSLNAAVTSLERENKATRDSLESLRRVFNMRRSITNSSTSETIKLDPLARLKWVAFIFGLIALIAGLLKIFWR